MCALGAGARMSTAADCAATGRPHRLCRESGAERMMPNGSSTARTTEERCRSVRQQPPLPAHRWYDCWQRRNSTWQRGTPRPRATWVGARSGGYHPKRGLGMHLKTTMGDTVQGSFRSTGMIASPAWEGGTIPVPLRPESGLRGALTTAVPRLSRNQDSRSKQKS